MNCQYCKMPIIGNSRQAVGCHFHPDCFKEWKHNVEQFHKELDRPVNDCAYFVRLGKSMYGHYIRDGKSCPCLAIWTESEVFGSFLFTRVAGEMIVDETTKITVHHPRLLLERFRDFLNENNWLNNWYVSRTEPKYLDKVLNNHYDLRLL